jgi:hypothetical protein
MLFRRIFWKSVPEQPVRQADTWDAVCFFFHLISAQARATITLTFFYFLAEFEQTQEYFGISHQGSTCN